MSVTERLDALLEVIVADTAAILGENLVGIYLHGSAAFGCFSWASSDIDYLTVTRVPPTQAQKEALIAAILARDAELPPKGIEMSVLTAADCASPCHPIPYTLHYSNDHRARYRADLAGTAAAMHGRDPDLAAHITVLHAVGRTLVGLPTSEVFGSIARGDYLDSVLADVADAPAAIAGAPVYTILNLCRTLVYLGDGVVRSKAQGGRWGMAHLSDVRLIEAALAAYCNGSPFPQVDSAALVAFARDMLGRIETDLR